MTDTADIPQTPDPSTLYKHQVSIIRAAKQTWDNRGLIRVLAERSLRVRYKQALLGFAWAFVSPIALLLAIMVLSNSVGAGDDFGAPKLLYYYVGLLPWTFFATVLNTSANSILANLSLIQKIACPREVFPLSTVVMGVVDTLLSSTALIAMFALEQFMPKATSIWVPVILVVHLTFVVGVAIAISVATVYFRDIRNAIPLLVQVGLFATPVIWAFDKVPEQWRNLYSLYPLAPVIDSYRRTILLGQPPQWQYLGIAALSSLAILMAGFWVFKRMEARIADVA